MVNWCKLLEKLDINGQLVTFKKDGSSRIKTSLGGIVTIITIILFLSLLYNFSQDIIYRHNPTIIQEKLYQPHNTEINLAESKDLFFGFSLYRTEQFRSLRQHEIDKRIFNITITHHTISKEGEYKVNRSKELGFRRCREDDIHENATELFRSNDLGYAMCIDNKNVTIFGQYESNVFQYVRILVKKCKGEHCLPDEEINKEIGKLRIAFYFTFGSESLQSDQDFNTHIKNFG
jgi:hypothetical protein